MIPMAGPVIVKVAGDVVSVIAVSYPLAGVPIVMAGVVPDVIGVTTVAAAEMEPAVATTEIESIASCVCRRGSASKGRPDNHCTSDKQLFDVHSFSPFAINPALVHLYVFPTHLVNATVMPDHAGYAKEVG